MSTFIIGAVLKGRSRRQITDLEVVGVMTLLGLALAAAFVWLGFGADAVQGLTS